MENSVKPAKLSGLLIAVIVMLSLAIALLFLVLSTLHGHKRHSLWSALQIRMDNAGILLDNGHAARLTGDLKMAKANLEACVRLHTARNAPAEAELGQIYEKEGQPDKAFAAYQQAFGPLVQFRSNFSADIESLARYGLLAEQRGQWAEAVRVYEQARQRLDPRPPIALNFDPQVEPTAQHWDFDPQAQPTALQLSQLRAMLNVVRGIVLDEQDKHQDALAAYAEAVRLQPRQAVAQYYLGYGLQKAGRSAKAKAAFAKAAQFGQGDVKAAAEKALKR